MRSTRSSLAFSVLACLSLAACRTAPQPSSVPPEHRRLTAADVQPLDPGQQAAAGVTAGREQREIHYGFLFSGNRAGSAATRVEPDGTLVCTFEFNDRG